MCVSGRERDRERERVCVCVWERERERERERECVYYDLLFDIIIFFPSNFILQFFPIFSHFPYLFLFLAYENWDDLSSDEMDLDSEDSEGDSSIEQSVQGKEG